MHVLLMTKLVFADSSATGQFEFTSLRANCSKALLIQHASSILQPIRRKS